MAWSVELDVSQYAPWLAGPVLISVEETDSDEGFTDSLSTGLAPLIGPQNLEDAFSAYDVEKWGSSWWLTFGDRREDRMPVWTGPNLTVGELREFLGERPERLTSALNIGAPDPFPIIEGIWNLIVTGLTLNDIRKLVFESGYSAVYRHLYVADWKAYADWKHTGVLTMPLEQAGRSEGTGTP
jgi:hypothetical protein